MKKLISMTDFLPDHPYSKFLKQPLEKWMFIPCNKDGDVLKEQKNPFFVDEYKEYQQAKERCLFKEFELKGETGFSWIFKHNGIFPVIISKQRNIEYLVTILKREIQLTPTALKQIGL